MALYLGSSEKLKINLNGITYCLNLLSTTTAVDHVWLLSSDNYVLADSSGIYLIPNDYTESIISCTLLSFDNYILKDSNGLYLTTKESE